MPYVSFSLSGLQFPHLELVQMSSKAPFSSDILCPINFTVHSSLPPLGGPSSPSGGLLSLLVWKSEALRNSDHQRPGVGASLNTLHGQEGQQKTLCLRVVRGSWVGMYSSWVILVLLCHILVHGGFLQSRGGGRGRGRRPLTTKWRSDSSTTKPHPLAAHSGEVRVPGLSPSCHCF